MTPLEKIIRTQIELDGPMPLDRYIALCLGHPEHGYYMTRDPFGTDGDFTTAPEISQVFGELIGVWVANAWETIGAPKQFALVELGPGRGTLMNDILRVLQKAPRCAKAVQVHFVETSETLRAAQREKVPTATWHAHVGSLPALPSIIIANEFFDALPIRQFVKEQARVAELLIGLESDALVVKRSPSPYVVPAMGEGVFEDASIRNAVATQLGDNLAKLGGAALIIDYGHMRTAIGDTLQAVQAHKFCSILHEPGHADITSHVDFEGLARGFVSGGAKIAGLFSQQQFLRAMGLEKRVEALTSRLDAEQQQDIASAALRLVQSDKMGDLFKVLCVTSPELAAPYPFGET